MQGRTASEFRMTSMVRICVLARAAAAAGCRSRATAPCGTPSHSSRSIITSSSPTRSTLPNCGALESAAAANQRSVWGLRSQERQCSASLCCSSAFSSSASSKDQPETWQRGELRVFVHPTSAGGGNPVTTLLIPASEPYPDEQQRAQVAKSCSWESAFVRPSQQRTSTTDGSSCAYGTMRFHVPSGPGMDMCAHAAIGASVLLADTGRVEFSVSENDDAALLTAEVKRDDTFNDPDDTTSLSSSSSGSSSSAAAAARWSAALALPASSYQESTAELLSPEGLVQDMLERHLGLAASDLLSDDPAMPIVNSGVMGRTKTMVPLRSVDLVNAARAPSDPDAFREWCSAVGSTGVYLYAKFTSSSSSSSSTSSSSSSSSTSSSAVAEFECRQFPWSSGYPEDPATGVAAMALALSLRQAASSSAALRSSPSPSTPMSFAFHQGRAMGMPSLIKVQAPPLQATAGSPAGNASRDSSVEMVDEDGNEMMVVCEGLVERSPADY